MKLKSAKFAPRLAGIGEIRSPFAAVHLKTCQKWLIESHINHL